MRRFSDVVRTEARVALVGLMLAGGLVAACGEGDPSSGGPANDDPPVGKADSNAVADHECRVVLRQIEWFTGGSSGWRFRVDVAEGLEGSVFLLYGIQWGEWKSVAATPAASLAGTPDGYQSFEGSFDGQGHPSMVLDAVAYVKLDGQTLYDHNFESGDMGFLSAKRDTNWRVTTSTCEGSFVTER